MHMKFITLGILSLWTSLALAQESDTSMEEIVVLGQELDFVSEGGSRLELSLKEIPATVDVIDGDAIRAGEFV